MAAHKLHLEIVGKGHFADVQNEAAIHVARYTGWTHAKALEFVEARATVELWPIDRRQAGVIYRAHVTVTV